MFAPLPMIPRRILFENLIENNALATNNNNDGQMYFKINHVNNNKVYRIENEKFFI